MKRSRVGEGIAAALLMALAALGAQVSAASDGAGSGFQETWWQYPRHDPQNRSAIEFGFSGPLSEPAIEWVLTAYRGAIGSEQPGDALFENQWGTYICIADADGDDELELITAEYRWSAEPWGVAKRMYLCCRSLMLGHEEWSYPLEQQEFVQWASPNVMDIDCDGTMEVVFGADPDRIVVLSGGTGKLWLSNTQWPFPDPSCLMAGHLDAQAAGVFVTSHGGKLHEGKLHEGKFCALFTVDRAPQQSFAHATSTWSKPTDGNAYCLPALADLTPGQPPGTRILFHTHSHDNEKLYCLAADGTESWSFAGSPSPAQIANAPLDEGFIRNPGYTSPIVADFLNDEAGALEVFFQTRCQAYMLDHEGQVLWSVPMIEGYGGQIRHKYDSDGVLVESTVEDATGKNGHRGDYAAAGDLNGDGQADIVMGLLPEYLKTYGVEAGSEEVIWESVTIEKIDQRNAIWALDGATGKPLWTFEGNYASTESTEAMRLPILVDLTGDGLLDVVTISKDTNLYGIRGTDGAELWQFALGSEYIWSELMGACVVGGDLMLVVIARDMMGASAANTRLQLLRLQAQAP